MKALSPRRLAVAGVVVVGAFAVLVLVLTRLGSGNGAVVGPDRVQPASSGDTGAAPPPPRGALVLATEAGSRAVALAVVPGSRPRLTATVLGSSGDGLSGLPLSFRVGPGEGRSLVARPCGPGCYVADAPPGSRLRRVEVLLPGGPVVFRLPASTQPGAAIVARSARAIRRLRSMVYFESLRSGPTGGLRTIWRIAAPDRLTYQIEHGASAVVIGRRRWDRLSPGARWARSQQDPPLRLPQPAWGDLAVDAHVLGKGRVDGRPVWVVSFANPGVPAWFTVWIDRGSYRPLRLRMTAAAHFMYHRYESFDRPLVIRPPR